MLGIGGFFKLDGHIDFASGSSAVVLEKAVLRSLVEEHLGGVQNRRLLVWSLLNVEEYLAGSLRNE